MMWHAVRSNREKLASLVDTWHESHQGSPQALAGSQIQGITSMLVTNYIASFFGELCDWMEALYNDEYKIGKLPILAWT